MPIYEYRCNDCNNSFDVFKRNSGDESPCECEHCQSVNTSKQVTTCAFISNGPGHQIKWERNHKANQESIKADVMEELKDRNKR